VQSRTTRAIVTRGSALSGRDDELIDLVKTNVTRRFFE
jgi:hypothetical protein